MHCETCPAFQNITDIAHEKGGRGQCKLLPQAVAKSREDWCMKHPERAAALEAACVAAATPVRKAAA